MKSILKQIGQYFLMLNKTFSFPEKKNIFLKQLSLELEKIGLNSLGIVTVISFFIGAVVSIQTAFNFESPLYPKYLIGYATRESLILEFCPTMLALILAGKVGSNIASEIGSMRVTEQIDALEIMGVNSASFLILPKIFATVLFFPIFDARTLGSSDARTFGRPNIRTPGRPDARTSGRSDARTPGRPDAWTFGRLPPSFFNCCVRRGEGPTRAERSSRPRRAAVAPALAATNAKIAKNKRKTNER